MVRLRFAAALSAVLFLVLVALLSTLVAADDPPPFDVSTPVTDRRVSLEADQISRLSALTEICSQAGAKLRWDAEALAEADLDPAELLNVSVANESLADALRKLLNIEKDSGFELRTEGVVWRVEGDVVQLTTMKAYHAFNRENVPAWIADQKGLHGHVNLEGQVEQIYAVGDSITDEILSKVAAIPSLRRLQLYDCNRLTKEGIAQIGTLTGLEELQVGRCINQGDAVLQSLRHHPSLQSLKVKECGTTDEGVRSLRDLPNLKHLEIHQEGRLTDAALDVIPLLTELRYLSLASHVATGLGWMRFSPSSLARLSALKKLEVLNLDGHDFPVDILPLPQLRSLTLSGDTVDDRIAPRLVRCENLQHISFEFTQIGDATLQEIAGMDQLRTIAIRRGNVTDAGLQHLTALPQLTSINLNQVTITNDGIAHLAEIKSLTRIDLATTTVDATGLSVLKDLPHLRTLWLMGCRDANGFADLKELTQLRSLHFEMCSLNKQQYHALEAALPETTITAGNGGGWLRSSRKESAGLVF
jgi:Leucine-rich repeat (LRR) protein